MFNKHMFLRTLCSKNFLCNVRRYNRGCGIGHMDGVSGFGVWALVAQQLFNVTVDTIILWITVKWRPSRSFRGIDLKGCLPMDGNC